MAYESEFSDTGIDSYESQADTAQVDYGAEWDMYDQTSNQPGDNWNAAMGAGVDEGSDYAPGPGWGAPSTPSQNQNPGYGATSNYGEGARVAQTGGLGGYSPNVAPNAAAKGTTRAGGLPAAQRSSTAAARKVVQISRAQYEGPAPTLNLPQYDEREIAAMTQKELSPAVRALRSGVRQAMMQTYENPNVRGTVLAKALEGYGMGVERAMVGAGAAATQKYQQKYGIARENAMSMFQVAMANYEKTRRNIQIQEPYETEKGLEKVTDKKYGIA